MEMLPSDQAGKSIQGRVVMSQTLKVSSVNSRPVKQEKLAYRVACPSGKPLGSRMMMSVYVDSIEAQLASLRERVTSSPLPASREAGGG